MAAPSAPATFDGDSQRHPHGALMKLRDSPLMVAIRIITGRR
jgi:hypothetical protein